LAFEAEGVRLVGELVELPAGVGAAVSD